MSQHEDIGLLSRSISPNSLKRKRVTADLPRAHSSSTVDSPQQHLVDHESVAANYSRTPRMANADGSHDNAQYRSPASDENRRSHSGEFLQGAESTSSLASGASSVFSQHSHLVSKNGKYTGGGILTPHTQRSEVSPSKVSSPRTTVHSNEMATTNGYNGHALATDAAPSDHLASQSRPKMLPAAGKAKGYRAVWDPELDGKLSKEERKRAAVRKRVFGTEIYQPDPPPDPRLSIPGYMSGNCRTKHAPSKAILRIAPYSLAPYKVDRHSIGPGEAQQVVAVGFDPFLPEATLRLNFSAFGAIASIHNRTDPETGSFLGVALIKYRDTVRDGEQISATIAAKRAETELNGMRIGAHAVKVELDREGRRCQRAVDNKLQRIKDARAKEVTPRGSVPPPPAIPEPIKAVLEPSAPPPNAPKGPSGKGSGVRPPEGPRAAVPMNPKAAALALVEEEPILGKIKRKPYIFIPPSSVPVLGTTIPHLKKRLKAYDWREIRLDESGYYVVFEDSKRGEDETERCYNECNKAALFTYFMEMECQKYGNPNYERSPSPQRVQEDKKRKEDFERLQREEEEDIEIEKKRRAENLDPVLGALEQLRIELKDRIMGDIKTRVAIPTFHESLEPSKHAALRCKLGLPDPLEVDNRGPALLFNKANGDVPSSLGRGRPGLHQSKPLRPHDPNQQRGRKTDRDRLRAPENAFVDERRRRTAPKASHARGLHFRLQQMYAEDEESDDEAPMSATHDTEDQESRPLSRTSRNSTPFDSESVVDSPSRKKRRKTTEWDEEDKDESFNPLHKDLLGHLLQKEPEDLATRELELVVNTLPRSSKFATRARTELFLRQRSKADDDLFQIPGDAKHASMQEDMAGSGHMGRGKAVVVKTDKDKPKRKRKTKKQLLEEQAALEAASHEDQTTDADVGADDADKIEEDEGADMELDLEIRDVDKDIAWSFTHDKPRRTVEDEDNIVLDIDGWQNAIKDEEDLAFAKQAFGELEAAYLGDVKLWAWKQKEIKALNTGVYGPVESETRIQGYYVPNSTGSARTEGVKKILNEEKSKYLPHRIKVQRAREERQAQAKADPSAAAEAAKIIAAERMASTAASRSNRVNNRRLVNDINLQKQTLATANNDVDVAIRFNQLKKRKKLVKFDRSAIHGWGLYAEENIAINDLIIEYVGEKVRQKVADLREQKYDRQGVGSSYLFRMLDDEIVDATKKGGIARFINHSCNPNCTAKIIKVEGTPRIVIYALKDILKNDELTYDYKFEREYGATDRIPCLCGSANCKGFLN